MHEESYDVLLSHALSGTALGTNINEPPRPTHRNKGPALGLTKPHTERGPTELAPMISYLKQRDSGRPHAKESKKRSSQSPDIPT
ncbi:hypothetical protein Tco_1021011 [Tanacetum coccineum]